MPAPNIGSELRSAAPGKNHTATFIFLHGLGDNGFGWGSILTDQWHEAERRFQHVDMVFPHAASRPITINGGTNMPGWYDITSFDGIAKNSDDPPGIKESSEYIQALIAHEITTKGIPPERIVLGGFSQGGAMSLFSGLTGPTKLAGIVGLSSYVLLKDKFKALAAEAGNVNKDTKILMGHGDVDQVVRYNFGTLSYDFLKEAGYSVEFKTYPGVGHNVSPKGIADLAKYLEDTLPPLAQTAGASQGNL